MYQKQETKAVNRGLGACQPCPEFMRGTRRFLLVHPLYSEQEEMVDDLGICLTRMEGISLRARKLRKHLEFNKLIMIRRMDTLEQDNILMDIYNILDPGVEDGGGANKENAAVEAWYPITTTHT
jgi:hypothetical protein